MLKVQHLSFSKCIWDMNKVTNSHNCHGSKRFAQGRVRNGVERVPFEKSQTSPWGCVLQCEPPGVMALNIFSPQQCQLIKRQSFKAIKSSFGTCIDLVFVNFFIHIWPQLG